MNLSGKAEKRQHFTLILTLSPRDSSVNTVFSGLFQLELSKPKLSIILLEVRKAYAAGEREQGSHLSHYLSSFGQLI